MENGKIVLEGPAGHLMSDPAIISTYLGQVLDAPASVA
jgi:ABC-type branched-subunit amino acid transport system ATPase component